MHTRLQAEKHKHENNKRNGVQTQSFHFSDTFITLKKLFSIDLTVQTWGGVGVRDSGGL